MESSNKRYDLLFITTFLNYDNIYLFLESLTLNNDVNLRVVLVAQNGLSVDLSRYEFKNISIDVVSRAEKLPISIARNVGLHYAKEKQIDYYYVMFPDDDSTFDASFFENFKTQINGNTLIGVRTRQNISHHYLAIPNNRTVANRKTDYRYAISVNILVDKATVEAVGEFDDELGVGCYYGAGEDCDFYIRASKLSKFHFNNKLYSIHPAQTRMDDVLPYSQLIARYKSYGRGAVYMFCKNRLFSQAFSVVLRGFLGSVSCLLRGRFKMFRVYFTTSFIRSNTLLKYIYTSNKKTNLFSIQKSYASKK